MAASLRLASGAALAVALAPPGAAQEPPHRLPGVETARVVLEARVVDGRGNPVAGLGPADFALEVDGRPRPVESVVWVAEGVAATSAPPAAAGASGSMASPGRLVVLLFQKDLSGSRLRGLMRSLNQADSLLATLGPRDSTAVLTFDSHLRLHLDFTTSHAALKRTLRESVLLRWPGPLDPSEEPSLAARLDPWDARRAASPEEALEVLARALEATPGAKAVLLFGWGLGRLSGGQVVLGRDYEKARAALERARAAVFCLDVTDADHHSLEVGLQQVAEETGGQYVRVNDNAGAALARVAAALSGHYVLAFERPEGPRGEHRVRLSLASRRGTVLTRDRYVD